MLGGHEAMKEFDKNVDTIENEREASATTQRIYMHQMQFPPISFERSLARECIIQT